MGEKGGIQSATIPFPLPLLMRIINLFEMCVWEVCSDSRWTPRTFPKWLFHVYILSDKLIIRSELFFSFCFSFFLSLIPFSFFPFFSFICVFIHLFSKGSEMPTICQALYCVLESPRQMTKVTLPSSIL